MRVFEISENVIEALDPPEYCATVEFCGIPELREATVSEPPYFIAKPDTRAFCLRLNCTDAECTRKHDDE